MTVCWNTFWNTNSQSYKLPAFVPGISCDINIVKMWGLPEWITNVYLSIYQVHDWFILCSSFQYNHLDPHNFVLNCLNLVLALLLGGNAINALMYWLNMVKGFKYERYASGRGPTSLLIVVKGWNMLMLISLNIWKHCVDWSVYTVSAQLHRPFCTWEGFD